MVENKARLSEGGRIAIPAEFRKALGLRPGDDLVLVLEEDEVRVLTPQGAVRRAQALVRQYVRKGRNLANELVRDRRDEAARG